MSLYSSTFSRPSLSIPLAIGILPLVLVLGGFFKPEEASRLPVTSIHLPPAAPSTITARPQLISKPVKPMVVPARFQASLHKRLTSRAVPFEAMIQRVARETELDPLLIKAVIAAESQFHVREVSPAGACGLMQLMPRTARLLQVKDIFDPEENIRAGSRHLKYLLARFSNDLVLSLAAYNAGEWPVLHYKDVPPYDETQFYVRKVLKYYQIYLS